MTVVGCRHHAYTVLRFSTTYVVSITKSMQNDLTLHIKSCSIVPGRCSNKPHIHSVSPVITKCEGGKLLCLPFLKRDCDSSLSFDKFIQLLPHLENETANHRYHQDDPHKRAEMQFHYKADSANPCTMKRPFCDTETY